MSIAVSKPSFQSLYIEMQANGLRISSGTAFIVLGPTGKGFLLTNRHNVTGRDQETNEPLCKKTSAVPDAIVIWHNSSAELGQFHQVSVPLYFKTEARWIEHPSWGKEADLVALPISKRPDIVFHPYSVDGLSHLLIEPAQTVSIVGFPFGEKTGASFAVWATGFVASEPSINHGKRPVFLVDCRGRKGQSGSPVILHRNLKDIINEGIPEEERSILLGIYSGRINEESDLGIVWKAYMIAELVAYADAMCAAS